MPADRRPAPQLATAARPSQPRPLAGRALIEGLVGLVAAGVLLASAVTVYTQQLRALRDTVMRQRQEQDTQDLLDHLRREFRRAGHVREGQQSTEQAAITTDGSGSSLQVHYRSDPVEPDRPTGRGTYRLQQQALQWRTPSTGGHQQLVDPQYLSLTGWAVTLEPATDCGTWVRITLQPAAPAPARHTVVRRRNAGVLPCEAR